VAGGRSESVRFPEAGIGIVILGNTDDMGPFSLARRIVDILLGHEQGPPRAEGAAKQLRKAQGLYRAEESDDVFGIAFDKGEPVFVTNMGAMPIGQTEEGAFMPERGILPLEFIPRDDGDIDTRWFGSERRFRRLSDTALPTSPSLCGRYADPATGFAAEIGSDTERTVIRLSTPSGIWEAELEARAPDLYLALPRRIIADTEPPPVSAGGWLFTIRSVAGGIVLNDDRTKQLMMLRA